MSFRGQKQARWADDLSLATAAGDDDGAVSGGDRLTSLPDTLRLHILSLLPLKFAIRTDALSSQWRGLWRHRWPSPSPSVVAVSPNSGAGGSDVTLISGPVDVLHLSLRPGRRHDADLTRWLSAAATAGVADLHLDLNNSTPSPSPRHHRRRGRRHHDPGVGSSVQFANICACPNLCRLTICGLNVRGPLSTFRGAAASLEVLRFYGTYVTDSALKKIVATCPLLRSLEVWGCSKLRSVVIVAASHRLADVVFVNCCKASEVTVSALGLRSFRFVGNFLRSYSIERPEGLEDVYMSSRGLMSIKLSNWVQSFGSLANVKALTLCSLSLQYIASAHAKAVRGLMNLQQLKELQLLMSMMTNSNLNEIYSFFSFCECPRLEKLFVELPTDMHDPFLEKFLEVGEEEPRDVEFHNLKIVKMKNFEFHKNEIQLVKFLLERASSLESLVIVVPPGHVIKDDNGGSVDDQWDMMYSKLSLLTRASTNCQIILSESDNRKIRHKHSEFLL